MSAALFDDLLSDLLAAYSGPARTAHTAPTLAKAANPANSEDSPGKVVESPSCEGLRIPANRGDAERRPQANSQTFAAIRSGGAQAGSPVDQADSQLSQDSQRSGSTCTKAEADGSGAAWQRNPLMTREQADACHSPPWDDAEIEAFTQRRDRLMRWGYSQQEADDLAERLTLRDREGDDRVSCADCRHYRRGRCGNHAQAGISEPEVGRALVAMLRRCRGFSEAGA